MCLASISRESRQRRTDDALVIEVGEDGEDRCSVPRLRRERRDCSQRNGDEGMC